MKCGFKKTSSWYLSGHANPSFYDFVMGPYNCSLGLVLVIKTLVGGSYIGDFLVKHLNSFKGLVWGVCLIEILIMDNWYSSALLGWLLDLGFIKTLVDRCFRSWRLHLGVYFIPNLNPWSGGLQVFWLALRCWKS